MRKPTGYGDSGTFPANAVRSGNSNAMNHVDDDFNRVKEFFDLETEALVVSTYLNTFDSTLPDNIKLASNIKQREWLHDRIKQVLINTQLMDIERLVEMRREDPESGTVKRCMFNSMPLYNCQKHKNHFGTRFQFFVLSLKFQSLKLQDSFRI